VAPDEARIPVIVGTGQSIERDAMVSALELAARAAQDAVAAAGALRAGIDQVSVVNILSHVGLSPASHLARRLGISPRRTEVTTIGGNSPQWLVNRAAADIAAGRLETALIVGAEAQRSAKVGGAGQGATTAEDTIGDAFEGLGPDAVVGDARSGVGDAEIGAGLIAPVHVYALFESVMAWRAGRSPARQRAALGQLMAPFTEVAATHPAAWFPDVATPGDLATVTPDNRLVAEPYPKRMCAFLQVDQGAAVLMTSLGAARGAGLVDQVVFCWSGAEATDVWFPTARRDLGASPALRAAASAAMGAARLGVDDIGAFDVYSCFPCAVEMAVEALGVSPVDARGLTVTGGLPYFGGPGNNYSLHAVATMADRVRERGGTGLVSALGWYATKHAVGIYSATPGPGGWRRGDTDEAQRAIDASALPVATEAEGSAVVVASTVASGPGGAVSAAPVIALLADGRRIAAGAAPDELSALAGRNLVDEPIEVSGTPMRYRMSL
jgi:acetyl-CoA C-acetyltransferase